MSLSTSKRSITPHRREISTFSAFRPVRLLLLIQWRRADPRLAPLPCDLRPAGGAPAHRRLQPIRVGGVAALRVGDERRRVARLGQDLVVHVPVVV
jgi:hypothetical protein